MQEESQRKINNLFHSNTCHTLEEIQVAMNETRCFTGSSDNSRAHATEVRFYLNNYKSDKHKFIYFREPPVKKEVRDGSQR